MSMSKIGVSLYYYISVNDCIIIKKKINYNKRYIFRFQLVMTNVYVTAILLNASFPHSFLFPPFLS